MVILSDLSEVLINGVEEVGRAVANEYGIEVGKKCFDRLDETKAEFNDLMRGYITENEYFKIFLSGSEWPFQTEDLQQIFSEEFEKEIPGTFDVYRRIIAYPRSTELNGKNHGKPPIYIVSDHIAERRDEIMGYHKELFSMTKDQIWSFDVGKIKSDPGFFKELLDRLAVRPDEAVFIDDYNRNIFAASAVGITSILFENATQLEDDLTDLGFEFSE